MVISAPLFPCSWFSVGFWNSSSMVFKFWCYRDSIIFYLLTNILLVLLLGKYPQWGENLIFCIFALSVLVILEGFQKLLLRSLHSFLKIKVEGHDWFREGTGEEFWWSCQVINTISNTFFAWVLYSPTEPESKSFYHLFHSLF